MNTSRNRCIQAEVVQGPWPIVNGERIGFNPATGSFLLSTMDDQEISTVILRNESLPQKVDIFMDPFGRHTTKIGQVRVQRQQPPISLEALRLGRKEQLAILKSAWPFPDDFPDTDNLSEEYKPKEDYKSNIDEGKQIRITIAALTMDRVVLQVLTLDPSREVR